MVWGSSHHNDTLTATAAITGSTGVGRRPPRRGRGADRLNGGGGTRDILDYTYSDAGVTVNLATGVVSGGHAEGDTIGGFENIRGSSHDDTLIGDGGDNEIWGGRDADRLDGGVGTDTLDYEGSDAGVTVNLATGVVSGGHAEGDTIDGFENVRGSSHDDTLVGGGGDNLLEGSDGADILNGGGGNDRLYGQAGADELYGSDGDDTLNGGGGNDRLIGSGGNDRIWGGAGADEFIFAKASGSNDTLVDFAEGEDLIDLSAYGLSGFGDVNARQVGNHVRIDLSEHDGGTIVAAQLRHRRSRRGRLSALILTLRGILDGGVRGRPKPLRRELPFRLSGTEPEGIEPSCPPSRPVGVIGRLYAGLLRPICRYSVSASGRKRPHWKYREDGRLSRRRREVSASGRRQPYGRYRKVCT